MRVFVLAALAIVAASASAGLIEPALQEQMAQVDGRERLGVMIALTRQLDAEQIINTVKDKQQRWETTVNALKEMASYDQAGLLSELRSFESSGKVADIQPLWIVNAVYCEATPEVINRVADRSEVWFVQWNSIPTENALAIAGDPAGRDVLDGSFSIEWNVRKVKADSVWFVHGYTGDGVVIGNIDTGCDYTHPDLADHMWTDANYPYHGWNFELNNNNPMDAHGHGTHTCGTNAGDGTGGDTTGMAPNAQIMTCRTKTSLSPPMPDTIAENTVMNAMQFCVAPPLSPANHAHLLSMSLGWLHSWTPRRALWRQSVTNVAAAGLPFFIANGNEGAGSPPDNVRTPGDCPNPWRHPAEPDGGRSGAISIGATDNADNLAGFSSRGPVSWSGISPYNDYPYPPGLYKPDFSAPGVDVTSTRLGGGYTQMSGTSMATPCAAGICALMLEKNPNLLPEEVSEIMQNSVLPRGTQPKNNEYGTGRIDALRCIENTPLPGPRHDVALDKVLAPQAKIDPLVPLAPVCIVKNRGTFPEPNVQVYCKVESLGTTIYSQSQTITLLDSAGVDTVTFPNWNVGPGSQTYDLTFWHFYSPDTNRRNDTLRQSTTTRGHDLSMQSMNVGSRVRALTPFTPTGFIYNLGDYTEAGFSAFCKIESAGVQVYSQTVVVDSVPIGATRPVAFPAWNVGPESTHYTLTMWHNCGPDQNRLNDTLVRTTMSSASVLRVAIEIAAGSNGRYPPNACYRIDSLCRAQGWTDSIVVGTDIDQVSELANYDVVVTGDVGYNDNDFLTYQSALLQWVRQGGGFVGLGWIVYGIANQNAWQMDSCLAVQCGGHYRFLTSGTVNVLNNTHPVTAGVGTFNVYGHGEYAALGIWPDATMLGDYSAASGQASIAVRNVGAGRSVYLGPIYFATFSGYQNEPYYDDPDAMRLLKQALEWAAWGATGVESEKQTVLLPRLTEARPNPFSIAATICYDLPRAGHVNLAVYDLAGKLVRTLVSAHETPGAKSLLWNRTDNSGHEVANGVYFVKLAADNNVATRKLVVK